MSPRYSIIPGAFCDDERARLMHYKVMTRIGRHTRRSGWCEISQSKLADALGVARKTVNEAIRDLARWGYLEKRSQAQTGRSICYYRVITDIGGLGDEDTDDGVGRGECDPQPHRGVTSEVTGGCNPEGYRGVTPEVTGGVTSSSYTINDPKRSNRKKTADRPQANSEQAPACGPAKADATSDEIGELNGATAAIVAGVASWLSSGMGSKPDVTTARKIIASNCAIYGADAVRRGFADMQADVLGGKLVGNPLKAFTGYCDTAKTGRAHAQPKARDWHAEKKASRERLFAEVEEIKAKRKAAMEAAR